MRIKAAIWVSAYIRRLNAMPIPATVVRRGDADAGAIYLKVNTLDGNAEILRPAAAGLPGTESERFWVRAFNSLTEEARADAYIARQVEFDPDIWVIEIEDREGRHYLDDNLLKD